MKKLIAGIAAILMMAAIAFGAASAEEAKISREDAMQTVLEFSKLKEDQVTFTKVRQDWDDGRRIWEIEFIFNGAEYDFDVDARTGRILEADKDRFDRDDDWDDWFDFD